jgi:hypothetical protein
MSMLLLYTTGVQYEAGDVDPFVNAWYNFHFVDSPYDCPFGFIKRLFLRWEQCKKKNHYLPNKIEIKSKQKEIITARTTI